MRDWLMWTVGETKHVRFSDGSEITFSDATYETLPDEERDDFVQDQRSQQLGE